MKQIRRGVFETNSSSTHSLTICSEKDWNDWKNGEQFLDKWEGGFVTKEEALKRINSNGEGFDFDASDEYETNCALRDCDLQSYEMWCDNEMEGFEQKHTTESGDKIVAFGEYGYDG